MTSAGLSLLLVSKVFLDYLILTLVKFVHLYYIYYFLINTKVYLLITIVSLKLSFKWFF